jgi:ATP/maltotriose-dependent transcriptional regulator MalT
MVSSDAYAIEEGKLVETIERARQAGEEFRKEQEPDQETQALALEARALLAQGKSSEAEAKAKLAKERLPKIQDRFQRLAVLVTAAPVLAARGGLEDIMTQLSAAEAEATKLGYGALRLEALLAESDIDRNPATARQRLQTVERDAKAQGLRLIATKAATRVRGVGK